MPQDYSLQIAIAVFFIALIVSRFLLLNAIKKLNEEDKAKLLSSKIINQSQTRLLIVFGLLGVYYFAITKYPQYASELVIGFLAIIIISRIMAFITQKKKLEELQLPLDYMKAFINSSVIYNVGLILFFFLLVKNYL